MVDQSHNLKNKIEAALQTVDTAQKLMLKAHLVDRDRLAKAQKAGDIITAERCLVDAFEADVRPILADWRKANGLPVDPIAAYRESGHADNAAKLRSEARAARGEVQSSSYA
jgi:L-rhamnose isomerase/sugar isomerase